MKQKDSRQLPDTHRINLIMGWGGTGLGAGMGSLIGGTPLYAGIGAGIGAIVSTLLSIFLRKRRISLDFLLLSEERIKKILGAIAMLFAIISVIGYIGTHEIVFVLGFIVGGISGLYLIFRK